MASTASATSSRVFAPVAGQSVTVDTLRIDVIDVEATTWTPPPSSPSTRRAVA